MHVPLHLAEGALALHLLLQGLERLVDIVVANENLNDDQALLWTPVPAPVMGRPVTVEMEVGPGSDASVPGAGEIPDGARPVHAVERGHADQSGSRAQGGLRWAL